MIITSKYELNRDRLGVKSEAFMFCCACDESIPAGGIFVLLERFDVRDGWDLIVMSPKGEVSRASSYHFWSSQL